jgi:hypothetical protein
MKEQKILTLANLQKWVADWVHNCELNHKNPSEVEFIIKDATERHDYRPFSGFLSFGHGVNVGIEFYRSDIIKFEAKDERPAVGEYWKSRGASSFDVSGFITSRAAGLRLLRMVKYILDTDEPKTWLDYREYEPNWIQFKFSAEEFDVEKLDDVSRANGGVLTEQIIRQCVKSNQLKRYDNE